MTSDFDKDEREYVEKHGGEWTDETPEPDYLKNFWFFEKYLGPKEKRDFFREIADFIREAREYGYVLPKWEPIIAED
jgi:hypothetical protein